MKAYYVLFLCMVWAICLSEAGLSLTNYGDTVTAYYSFDGTGLVRDDTGNGSTLTNVGATLDTGDKVLGNGSADFDGINDYFHGAQSFYGTVYFAVSLWHHPDQDRQQYIIGEQKTTDAALYIQQLATGTAYNGEVKIWNVSAGLEFKTTADYTAGTWHHLCLIKNITHMALYVDGSLHNITAAITGDMGYSPPTVETMHIGDRENAVHLRYDGGIDEVAFWMNNNTITESDCVAIYNGGAGQPLSAFPTGGAPPATDSLMNVTATDYYNGSGITVFNVTLGNGTIYTTTNGTVETLINMSANASHNITVKPRFHFGRTYMNYLSTSNLESENWQAVVNWQALMKVTGLNVTNFTAAVNNQSNTNITPTLLITSGTHTANFSKAGYYNASLTFSIPPQYNGTQNFTIWNTVLNVSAYNAFTNASIANFTGWVSSGAFNESFGTGTGHAHLNLTMGENYTVYVESPLYAIGENDNWLNVTLDNESQELNFSLWSNNSVRVYIYDSESGFLITTVNISITVSSGAFEETYYTTSGFYFVTNLTDGNYTFKLVGGNYTLRSYVVTVAERSTQVLNAYLDLNAETVTFALADRDSGLVLEGALCSMSRLINSTWTVIESKTSDITGRLQFTYLPTIRYQFLCTATDYDNKQFELDPVIFSTYTILMDRQVTQEDEHHFSGVGITMLPRRYENNLSQNLTFQIFSPDGALQAYGVTAWFPGSNSPQTARASNSYGSILTLTLNISGAALLDTVNVTFWYDTTYTENRSYTRLYAIEGASNPYTWQAAADNDYGFTAFEKVLIATAAVVVVAGAAFLFAGPVAGGVVALLILGVFYRMGFINVWMLLPAALVGVLMLFMGGGKR